MPLDEHFFERTKWIHELCPNAIDCDIKDDSLTMIHLHILLNTHRYVINKVLSLLFYKNFLSKGPSTHEGYWNRLVTFTKYLCTYIFVDMTILWLVCYLFRNHRPHSRKQSLCATIITKRAPFKHIFVTKRPIYCQVLWKEWNQQINNNKQADPWFTYALTV